MAVRALSGVAASVAVAMLSMPVSARQSGSVPGAPPQDSAASVQTRIAGKWQLDRQQTPGSQDAWRRRIDAQQPLSSAGQQNQPSAGQASNAASPFPVIRANSDVEELALIRSALRDLLEPAERLTIEVLPDAVKISDDLDRTLVFSTRGVKEKRQLAATEFNAKTTWTGQSLSQELTASSLKMTQLFLMRDDGQEMLIVFKIEKPDFSPPLKDIMRVYGRTKLLK